MKKENIFFISTLITFIAIRTWIILIDYFIGEKHLYFNEWIVHHFWFGFLILIIVMLISSRYKTSKLIILGVGFGLIADELVFMILGGGGFTNYLSFPSWSGAFAMIFILFFFRTRVLNILIKK